MQTGHQGFFYCKADGYIFLHLSWELKGDILCQYGFWSEYFNLQFAIGIRPNSDPLLQKITGINCSNVVVNGSNCSNIGFSTTHLL